MLRFAAACTLLCALSAMPASAQDFLAGVRSVDVTMHRVETCVASHYGVGDGYHGRRTASGEHFNTYAMTAAHRTRAFRSHVRVTNLANGRSVRVRITDLGPFVGGRCIDLSYAAGQAIGMGGLTRVTVERPNREMSPDSPSFVSGASTKLAAVLRMAAFLVWTGNAAP